MEEDWVNEEFFSLNLGDLRVDRSAKNIIRRLALQPGVPITQVFETHSEVKTCYEFLHNGKVTAEKILKPHKQATLNRIKPEPVVLLLNDTSSLNYTSKPSIGELGNISAKNNQGLFLHPLLAVTPSRINLGIVDAKIWAREQRVEELTRKEIYALPIEEKEAIRWAESYIAACKVAEECPNTQIITINDRESDFADFFEIVSESQKKQNYAHVIIRGSHDRALIDKTKKVKKKPQTTTDEENTKTEEDEKVQKKLSDKLKKSPALGTVTFTIRATINRKARIVTQVLKTSQITFKKRMAGSEEVTMNVVMAIEESPPPGVEPLNWWFLTTLPVDTFEQAGLIIQYYLARWEIEVFFKVLKSGCKVEERGLTGGALLPLIAMFLIISWRIMYAMKLGRLCPDMSADALFSSSEWKSAYKVLNKGSKLPDKPPRLGEFIIMIARLGGYLNRKNDPPPGPTVMWRGFNKMHNLTEAWDSFGPG